MKEGTDNFCPLFYKYVMEKKRNPYSGYGEGKNKLVSPDREAAIAAYLKETSEIGGVCAEVGVYKGGSAKVIAENKGSRPLYAFDTFSGIPVVLFP